MSDRITIKLEGSDKLVRKLQKLESAFAGEVLERAVRYAAQPVIEDASQKAPKLTGKLARNIGIDLDKKSRSRVMVSVGPEKDVFYGMFLELGTKHITARPFLRPALDENEQNIKRRLRDRLKRELRFIF